MDKSNYRICTKTVMDNIADPDIRFDEDGVCNYYHLFKEKLKTRVPPPGKAQRQLEKIIAGIKKTGRENQYDCVVGVSGGVDSTYVAWLAKEWGLRPLAVHVDNGWNSELAVRNIEVTLKKLDIDLYTEVLDWPAFSDLQRSFLKASTPDADIPSDHIIWAAVFRTANKFNIQHILSGMNFRTEGMLPPSWSRGYLDWKYIKAVQKQFSTKKINRLPHYKVSDMLYYVLVKRIKVIGVLNYIDFRKDTATGLLTERLDYRPYYGKHHESIYTRFFQSYLLPQKFGIDKRKAHLSCMIMGSNEITRQQALELLQQPIAPPSQIEDDILYIKKKLNISDSEMASIMTSPVKTIFDYPNNHTWELKLRKLINKMRRGKLVAN